MEDRKLNMEGKKPNMNSTKIKISSNSYIILFHLLFINVNSKKC